VSDGDADVVVRPPAVSFADAEVGEFSPSYSDRTIDEVGGAP
jgi:hypothetical protein